MSFEKNPDELGALWVKSGAKGDYLSGTINGVRVVAFRQQKRSENSPDYRVMKAKARTESAPSGNLAPVADDDMPF